MKVIEIGFGIEQRTGKYSLYPRHNVSSLLPEVSDEDLPSLSPTLTPAAAFSIVACEQAFESIVERAADSNWSACKRSSRVLELIFLAIIPMNLRAPTSLTDSNRAAFHAFVVASVGACRWVVIRVAKFCCSCILLFPTPA